MVRWSGDLLLKDPLYPSESEGKKHRLVSISSDQKGRTRASFCTSPTSPLPAQRQTFSIWITAANWNEESSLSSGHVKLRLSGSDKRQQVHGNSHYGGDTLTSQFKSQIGTSEVLRFSRTLEIGPTEQYRQQAKCEPLSWFDIDLRPVRTSLTNPGQSCQVQDHQQHWTPSDMLRFRLRYWDPSRSCAEDHWKPTSGGGSQVESAPFDRRHSILVRTPLCKNPLLCM